MTDRDLRLLTDIGRFRVLTSEQLKRRHFREQGWGRMWNRLRELCRAGYVERRVWGYDPERRGQRAGYLLTARGLRAAGLDVPATRHRATVFTSLPHDVTVADVAERVLQDLSVAGVAATWVTERELSRGGLDWLPDVWTSGAVAPDGVLLLGAERLAVEVDTTQHNSRLLTKKMGRYREALIQGVYSGVWWFAASGGPLASVERAVRAHGDPERMAVRNLPAGVSVYGP